MTMTKPTIAFIGLGIMGAPMAANLVEAGYDVTGYNRSRGKVDTLVSRGGRGADSIADAVADAEVIITMLPDSPDVEAVATGENGIFAHARPGSVWIDCSTIRPDVAAALAEQAATHGIEAIDAPVSGGEAGAVEGVLSIMVGGDGAIVDSVRPVLEVVGKTVVQCRAVRLRTNRQGRQPADRGRHHRARRRSTGVPGGTRGRYRRSHRGAGGRLGR